MKIIPLYKKLSAATILIALSGNVMAHKWLYDTCGTNQQWYTSSMTFNANPTGFDGPLYSKWLTSFQVALDRVNDTPANFNMYVRVDNDLDVSIGNGESEIWWGSGVSAVEYTTTSSCGVTIETDIIFHNDIGNTIPNGGYLNDMSDKTQFRGYGDERRSFETTAIHEIGHALGLGHENRYYNIMGNDYTHLHTTGDNSLKSYVGEDATSGLMTLYGSSNRQDLSVAQWRRVGSSGEYSSHARTRLFDSNGTVLASTKVQPSCIRDYCEMRHEVELGQQIQFEMTLENNGEASQTVELGYYISTNGTITNADTLIGTDNVTVTRNTPDTVIKYVTIPNNLLPNTNYYLGVIIDNAGQVSEWAEDNNSSYIYIHTGAGTQGSAPVAQANGPYSAAPNTAIIFSSAGSFDSDGTISSYDWDFGDGSVSTAENPSHSYTATGSYNVSLTVTDNSGLTGFDSAIATIGTTQTNYCNVTGGGSYEHIAGVAVGGINNVSSQENYGDFTSLTANLTSGTNSITLTPGFSGGSYTEHWGVWIDYNQDGDFIDAGEQVVSGQSGTSAITASFTPPSSASGLTRMRIGMQYNQAVTASCTNIQNGEFEDYSVMFSNGGGNKLPIANANGPYSGAVNTTINFDSNGTGDPDGTIFSYHWDFGDGNSANTANASHSYNSAGPYTAALTVVDNQGGQSTDSATVTVTDGSSNVPDACATQGSISGGSLSAGNVECLASQDTIWLSLPDVDGYNSVAISSGNGSGDLNIEYSNTGWPNGSNVSASSSNAGNSECIYLTNQSAYWGYIKISGTATGASIVMDFDTAGCR